METDLTEKLGALDQYAALPANWNGSGAAPPNASTVARARWVLEWLYAEGIPVEDILPSAEGGIGLMLSPPPLYADIEFFNNGEIIACYTDYLAPDRVRAWDVEPTMAAIQDACTTLRAFIGNTREE